MFDFFFKRARAGSSTGTGTAAKAGTAVAATVTPDLSQRRQQALDQAAALGADESPTLAFLLDCQVPEARLRAAEHLHSRPMLEQAQKAMRETDRRVSKLMQQRLSDLARQERSEQRMHAAIARAQALMAEAIVLPNQAVDLDRARAEAGSVSSTLEAQFAALRAELAERLQSQAALQRRAMDARAVLQARLTQLDDADSAQVESTLMDADAAIQEIEQDRALASLPKHLMPELRAARSQLMERQHALQASEAAVTAREQALDEWRQLMSEAGRRHAEPGATDSAGTDVDADVNANADANVSVNVNVNVNADADADADAAGADVDAEPAVRELPTPQSLRRQWQALPVVHDTDINAALQAHFDALLASLAPATRPNKTIRVTSDPTEPGPPLAERGVDSAQIRALQTVALQELRSALDEGALQRAVEQDRLLRSLDAGAERFKAGFTPEQQNALIAARAELTRLQGWARWGGTVSREELVVAVEGLPQQGLGVVELGKKVGSMRERWRALDATAGPAPRPLWLRFDAACGVAYAPVAAHFTELARQREARLEQARAILAEVSAFAAAAGLDAWTAATGTAGAAGAPDWRALGAFCQRMEQAWQRLGPLERKQQKQLNAAFKQALQPLRQPLQAQHEQAIAQRERLIDQVQQLTPQGRETLEQLQNLQAQWQQDAKALPLARAMEQQLWQRFRAACDAVFAQRKQAVVSADAERTVNLDAKTALCVALGQALADTDMTDAARAALLRDQRLAWNAIGPVPRAAQAALQARFDQAIGAVQGQRDAARQSAVESQFEEFNAAWSACLASECQLLAAMKQKVQEGQEGQAVQELQTLQPRWEPRVNVPAPLEQALRARFEAAQAALASCDTVHAQSLQENAAALATALLRLEVRLGLDSPTVFARERLQLQVAGLQSTFKSGSAVAKDDTPLLQLAHACAIAAITDAVAHDRMKAIAKAVLISH